MSGVKTNSGEKLRRQWKLPVRQARYHKDGTFFMPLEKFPGALCDQNGFVVFQTWQQYESSRFLQIGCRINIRLGISKLPEYVRFSSYKAIE